MVLDHLIRGLADEAIQAQVLAMQEEEATLPKVIKFIKCEKLAKWSNRNNTKKRCRRCGDNVWPHPDEDPCSGLNETCEFCSLKSHRDKACKRKKKSDKEKQEKNDGSKVELITTTGTHG